MLRLDGMLIQFVEIQNFRKLKSIRIDFSDETTLLVGANNSGKTSAMVALGHFLVDAHRFTTNDFTLSNWATINNIGTQWIAQSNDENAPKPELSEWQDVLPSFDVWLLIGMDEIHYARHLLPTLDWNGGLLGVRLRFEPTLIDDLYKEYLNAITAATATKEGANDGQKTQLPLWPQNMRDFLDRKLRQFFKIRGYLLDPANCQIPIGGIARLQPLPTGSEPIDSNPLDGLIRVDEIAAQRGLGDTAANQTDGDGQDSYPRRDTRKLSEQLRSYYSKHLDPSEHPEPEDLGALEAIHTAQNLFDERLATGFSAALQELQSLNYPGVTDPKLKIATKVRPTDGLNHRAAVQYEVVAPTGEMVTASLTLPEEYNGLGYQNLISMAFRLMSFRDAWMRVGKAGRLASSSSTHYFPPAMHLVLIEEPEAHLHVQVQQVFVRKAYDVLRNHGDLREKKTLRTQLIVSTHSSHVAHECTFSSLRYFRRLPADGVGNVPTSAVINLTEVFGENDKTAQFVTRYLRASHCELFFADAAVLVEGPAERILIPHFIREHFSQLHCCFVTLLEIGGSHAHRLRPLIEYLGLTTLIITDLDPAESTGRHKAVAPQRNCTQISRNVTLKAWHPQIERLDELLDLPHEKKAKQDYGIPLFSVCVAYQVPMTVQLGDELSPCEALAGTFEDSLVFENLSLFRELDGDGMVKKFSEAIKQHSDVSGLSEAVFGIVKDGDKAAFALDLLWLKPPKELKVPRYIREGLAWLELQVKRKHDEVLAPITVSKLEKSTHERPNSNSRRSGR